MDLAAFQSLSDVADPGANRVLLIERDPAIAQSLALILGSVGFAVDRTAHGHEGVSFATSRDYGLVLLGPNLPELEGGDLMAELRAGRIDAPLRFLSVSVAPGGSGNTMQITPCP